MATIDETENPEPDPNNNLETLYQEFGGTSFYGLEYIVDDLFQNIRLKTSSSSRSTVDWYGLYD
ncbi:MAG: hypothetical protein ACU841_00660 [Gammaproteobacteria bacterium]